MVLITTGKTLDFSGEAVVMVFSVLFSGILGNTSGLMLVKLNGSTSGFPWYSGLTGKPHDVNKHSRNLISKDTIVAQEARMQKTLT